MAETRRVLVVEDDWLIAQDHVSVLRQAGYEPVGPVPSVAAALNLIEKDRIDAAVLDIQLNNEKSFPIAEQLQGRNIPFAFLTGLADRDIPPRFRGHAVVVKPATRFALVETLARFFR